jgi:hypothetical protein
LPPAEGLLHRTGQLGDDRFRVSGVADRLAGSRGKVLDRDVLVRVTGAAFAPNDQHVAAVDQGFDRTADCALPGRREVLR